MQVWTLVWTLSCLQQMRERKLTGAKRAEHCLTKEEMSGLASLSGSLEQKSDVGFDYALCEAHMKLVGEVICVATRCSA